MADVCTRSRFVGIQDVLVGQEIDVLAAPIIPFLDDATQCPLRISVASGLNHDLNTTLNLVVGGRVVTPFGYAFPHYPDVGRISFK